MGEFSQICASEKIFHEEEFPGKLVRIHSSLSYIPDEKVACF